MNNFSALRSGAIACAVACVVTSLHAQVTTPPVLAPGPTLTVPAVERAVLPNGLTVLVSRNSEVPVVDAQLIVEGGERVAGMAPGVGAMTGTLLSEGAGGRSALKFAEEVDYLGAQIGARSDWETISVQLHAPKRNIDAAFALLADVVLRPTFSAVDVARVRDLRLTALSRARDQPTAVAARVFFRNLYPATHPYHRSLGGDSTNVAAIDSATLRAYWNRVATPRHATLVLTGDVTLAEATAWATKHLGNWQGTRPAASVAAASSIAAAPRPSTRIILVDKPGAAQSVIEIGMPGVDRNSPDYPAITLMNTILGGSFSARLNDFLREKLGYSYGASSFYDWLPVPGPFIAQSSVRTDVTDSSLIVFVREMKRMATEPVTPVELTRGRNYLVLGALSQYETASDVDGAISASLLFGRPLSSVSGELDAIKKLTAVDVQRAAQKYLDTTHMTVVIVGDLAKIRTGIEKLKLGTIEVQTY